MSARAARCDVPLAPRCFGYARSVHAFVCVGHDWIYNADHIGAPDRATNLRIDAVGFGTNQRWTIAATAARPATSRAVVERALGQLGAVALQTRAVSLAPNAWTTVAGHPLYFRFQMHEGDASYENFGASSRRHRYRGATGTS